MVGLSLRVVFILLIVHMFILEIIKLLHLTGRGRCFGFRVPSGVVKEALLAVRGEASDYVFAANKTVGIKAESAITFIQTDKPIYKPGQTGMPHT